MGSSGDIMHEFERKELKHAFPPSEGWRMGGPEPAKNATSVYRFTRDLWVGSEQVTVISLYSPVVSSGEIAQLRTRYLNGNKRNRLALLVPKGSDLTAVPADIRVIPLSGFGFEAGKLVWLSKKKGAKKYGQDETVPAGTVVPKAS